MINIEQTRWDACVCMLPSMSGERIPHVYESTRKGGDPHIIALVELDMKNMRVHIVLSREAIRERLQKLEYPLGPTTGLQAVSPVSKN